MMPQKQGKSEGGFKDDVVPIDHVKCYGCQEIVPLIKKHYKFCPDSYSQCRRPDCMVVASRGHIANPSKLEEEMDFLLNQSFQLTLYPDVHNTLILLERKHGLRFLLIKTSYHSWMSINRLDSQSLSEIDIEASVLVPGEPRWEIDREDGRELFAAAGDGATVEEIRQYLLENTDEKMRDYVAAPALAALHPQWIPLNVDLLKLTNLASPNKDKVEAHLVQLPWSLDPINIQISLKQKMFR